VVQQLLLKERLESRQRQLADVLQTVTQKNGSNPGNGSWRMVQQLLLKERLESRQRQLADRSSPFYNHNPKRI
jgi:hypothetical protein